MEYRCGLLFPSLKHCNNIDGSVFPLGFLQTFKTERALIKKLSLDQEDQVQVFFLKMADCDDVMSKNSCLQWRHYRQYICELISYCSDNFMQSYFVFFYELIQTDVMVRWLIKVWFISQRKSLVALQLHIAAVCAPSSMTCAC